MVPQLIQLTYKHAPVRVKLTAYKDPNHTSACACRVWLKVND